MINFNQVRYCNHEQFELVDSLLGFIILYLKVLIFITLIIHLFIILIICNY